MKRLLIAAALAVASTTTNAGMFTYQSEPFCSWIGDLATAFAHDRDAGATLDDAHRGIDDFRGEMDVELIVDARNVAEGVYLYPRLMPREEGNVAYDLCMETD